jgi:hypothetical protein
MFTRFTDAPRLPSLAWRAAGLGLVMLTLLLAACSASTVGNTPTPIATSTPTTAPPTATPIGYPVKIFFSRHPDSDSNVNAVFPVNRVSPTLGVSTYAIQQLIAGPTPAEAAANYYTELTAALHGASNCGGPDFTYTIDNSKHTGTLRFCKATTLPGDLSGARIKAEITATLTQFPNVTKVIILNYMGHCFDDLSGMDLCLK